MDSLKRALEYRENYLKKRRIQYAAEKMAKLSQQSGEQLKMHPENHSENAETKKVLVIANHRQVLTNNLSSLWKKKQLCDAGISNGLATVKIHKVVLSAVCPTLISKFGVDALSQDYIQINFPEEVSIQALNAFAEYMYNGVLDLNCNILKQLKIIANKLNMKEFEELCNSRLLKQSANVAKQPLIQTVQSIPVIPLLNAVQSPVSMDSTPSVTTPVVDTNQESIQHELGRVKMETDGMFGQEFKVASLASNTSGNSADVVSCANIKTEPVEPKDSKYDHLNSSSHQVSTTTTSPSSSASTSVSSLVSDESPVSCIGEPVCSQSSLTNEDSSKQLNRQSIPTPLQLPPTSTNNQDLYSGASSTASANNQGFTNVGTDIPHSQPTAMKGYSSKPLNKQSMPTPSIQHSSTSNNNEGNHSGGHFATSGDNQSLTCSTNVGADAPHSQSNKSLNRQSVSTTSVEPPSTSRENAGVYPVALFKHGGDCVSMLTPNSKSIVYKPELI